MKENWLSFNEPLISQNLAHHLRHLALLGCSLTEELLEELTISKHDIWESKRRLMG